MTNLSTEEREIWKEIYRIHERHHAMTGTPEEFLALTNDFNILLEQHNTLLCKHLCFGLMEYFEAKTNELKKAREEGLA